jgi:secondary thiamine-phosphate synthase enzyme
VKTDFVNGMKNSFPDLNVFRHSEGNSDAHLKSSSVGASETIIIKGGKLLLGTWQGIYFCEFDGPRERKFFVKVIRG